MRGLGGEIGGDLQAGGLGADLALPVMILSNATAPERTPGAGTGAGRAARVPHVADQAGEAYGWRMTRAERAGLRLEDVPRPSLAKLRRRHKLDAQVRQALGMIRKRRRARASRQRSVSRGRIG